MLLYGAFRLVLWCAGIGLALFPTVWALDRVADHSLLWNVNLDGRFRDLFFVLAPASVLALTTTLDFIWADHTTATARNAAILALLANIGVLISGFVGFFMVPEDAVLELDQFNLYWKVIVFGLLLSLTTELWISLASERHRQLNERNWNDLERVKERARVLEGGRGGRRR